MHYRLKIGEEQSLGLRVERLADLNETIDELFAELEREGNPALLEALCPYFGVVWPSGRALAEHLLDAGRVALAGRAVLEVGCGLALPSLIAARLGARVVATDFHPDIRRFLERNAALNSIEGVEFRPGDWQAEQTGLGKFDWVIGSDILYERQHPAPVARMLARHVAPGGRVWLADPGRPYLQAFADEMKGLGFACDVRVRTAYDEPAPKDVFILEMTSARERLERG